MGFNRLNDLYFKQNPEERRKYELREKAILDYNSDMAEAKRNGMEEARIKMIYDMVHTMGLSFEEIVKKCIYLRKNNINISNMKRIC